MDTNIRQKLQNVNIYGNKVAISELNRNIEPLLALLSLKYSLTFSKTGNSYTCQQSDGLKIFLSKKRFYTVQNHSQKLDVPNGNLEGQLIHLTKHLEGKERLTEQWAIISQISNHKPPQLDGQKVESLSNSPKRKITAKFGDFSTYSGKATFNYFRAKTGANSATLERYQVRPITARKVGKFEFKHGSDNFCFAYCTKTHTKTRQPTRPKGKQYTIQQEQKGTYCFGLEQLPKQGENLVICAGETDTICLNHHLNKYGFWGVCFGGEMDKINPNLLKALKRRFKRVYILYDNDPTGKVQSKLKAFKNGLIWVDWSNFSTDYGRKNDICEIYSTFKGDFELRILDLIRSNGRIEKDPKDGFSLKIDHCYKLYFDTYLTETEDNVHKLVSEVRNHRNTLIQSAAGTGKSWGIAAMIRHLLEHGRVIKAVPTKAIAEQITNTFRERIGNEYAIEGLWGKKDKYAISRLVDTRVIVTTYDSINHIPQEIATGSVLIIDEAHQLCNDIDYRNSAMRKLYKHIEGASRVIYLTATPNWYFFSKEIEPFLGKIRLIQGVNRLDNEVGVRILTDVKNKKHARYYIEENFKPQKGKTACYKLDNVTALDSFSKIDQERNISSEYFTSKSAEKSVSNAIYQSIMKDGTLGSKELENLYYTTLMEAGVSFKFPVSFVAVFDTVAPCKIVQLATRPRYNRKTGVNKHIELPILLGETAGKNASETQTENGEQLLQSLIIKSQKLADYKNGIEGSENPSFKVSTDFIETFTYKGEQGFFEVCIFSILHYIFKLQQKQQTPELLARRIQRYDPRFKILSIERADDFDKVKELQELISKAKVDKAEAEHHTAELLKLDPYKYCAAYARSLKKPESKERIKKELKLPNYSDLIEFISDNKKAFSCTRITQLYVSETLRANRLGLDIQEIANELAAKGLAEVKQRIDVELSKKRRAVHRSSKKELSTNDILQVEIDKRIRKKIDQLKKDAQRGRRSEALTGNELTRIVNKAIKGLTARPISKQKALRKLKTLYNIKVSKKTYKYTILDPK
jgi:late competence protein required for DNA uptake (superfamily II DNA/RNA helicase)